MKEKRGKTKLLLASMKRAHERRFTIWRASLISWKIKNEEIEEEQEKERLRIEAKEAKAKAKKGFEEITDF